MHRSEPAEAEIITRQTAAQRHRQQLPSAECPVGAAERVWIAGERHTVDTAGRHAGTGPRTAVRPCTAAPNKDKRLTRKARREYRSNALTAPNLPRIISVAQQRGNQGQRPPQLIRSPPPPPYHPAPYGHLRCSLEYRRNPRMSPGS